MKGCGVKWDLITATPQSVHKLSELPCPLQALLIFFKSGLRARCRHKRHKTARRLVARLQPANGRSAGNNLHSLFRHQRRQLLVLYTFLAPTKCVPPFKLHLAHLKCSQHYHKLKAREKAQHTIHAKNTQETTVCKVL